jgi:hypothetical protein
MDAFLGINHKEALSLDNGLTSFFFGGGLGFRV